CVHGCSTQHDACQADGSLSARLETMIPSAEGTLPMWRENRARRRHSARGSVAVWTILLLGGSTILHVTSPGAASIQRRQEGAPSPRVEEAQRLNKDVVSFYHAGRYQEALLRAERALKFGEQHLGPAHPEVAASLNNLALLYDAQGAYAQAEPL